MGSVEMNANVTVRRKLPSWVVGSKVAVAVELLYSPGLGSAIRAKIQLSLLQTVPFSYPLSLDMRLVLGRTFRHIDNLPSR